MKNDDAELIQRVLEGDDNAFSVLVRKYQKQVHALAWRKIEDFHIANGNSLKRRKQGSERAASMYFNSHQMAQIAVRSSIGVWLYDRQEVKTL